MQQIPQLALTEFIKANPYNVKWNYERIELIQNIVKKSAQVTTNMLRIEAVNHMLYILLTVES